MKKTWLVTVFVTTVLIGSIVTSQDNLAFAGGKHKKSNEAEQGDITTPRIGTSI